MRGWAVAIVLLASGIAYAQSEPAVPAARFVGTWVGTQRWAIPNPPPGASREQAVTLTIEEVDGKLTGSMRPFLGGEEGATFVESAIIGDELKVVAVVGRPGAGGLPRAESRGGWTAPVRIGFVFKNDGVNLTGSADVRMGDVPWTKFAYDLGKKRSRY